MQPVVVGIHVPPNSLFDFYTDGIWMAKQCPQAKRNVQPKAQEMEINHALLVVVSGWQVTTVRWAGALDSEQCPLFLNPKHTQGYADARGATPGYWIVKNSWGARVVCHKPVV